MTEKKINQVAEKEVRQLKKLIKSGELPKETVTFTLFVEMVMEDRNVPVAQQAELEERLKHWMAEIGFQL